MVNESAGFLFNRLSTMVKSEILDSMHAWISKLNHSACRLCFLYIKLNRDKKMILHCAFLIFIPSQFLHFLLFFILAMICQYLYTALYSRYLYTALYSRYLYTHYNSLYSHFYFLFHHVFFFSCPLPIHKKNHG